jgi:hypothetical protein
MQTRIGSFIESALNTASGFVVAFALWQWVIGPLMGYAVNYHDNLIITSIFTVASIARSYVWRRFFNKRSTWTYSK